MLQSSVRRQFATGLSGEIIADGPLRAKPARITSNGVATPNRIGRAFTYAADKGGTGATVAMLSQEVIVGGVGAFFGILGIPKHYALYGTNSPAVGEQAGPLSPTMDLPQGSEGEFVDMGIMLLDVTNGNDTSGVVPFGGELYYCTTAKVAAAGFVATTAADLGKLYSFHTPAGVDLTKWAKVPNAQIRNAVSGVASGAAVQTKVQLTQ